MPAKKAPLLFKKKGWRGCAGEIRSFIPLHGNQASVNPLDEQPHQKKLVIDQNLPLITMDTLLSFIYFDFGSLVKIFMSNYEVISVKRHPIASLGLVRKQPAGQV